MDIRIEESARRNAPELGRRNIADVLGRLVADTYVLYFQTQSFHWNVRGPHFAALHELFGKQYEALAEATDELAERMRALGALAPTSLPEILANTSIPLEHGAPPARAMIDVLLRGHEHLARIARDGAQLADAAGDVVTNDLLVQRAGEHDKTAWMLRSTLEE